MAKPKVSNSEALLSVWWLPIPAALVSGANTVLNGSGFGQPAANLGFLLDTVANTAIYSLVAMGVSAFFESRATNPARKLRWSERMRGSMILAISAGSVVTLFILILLVLAF